MRSYWWIIVSLVIGTMVAGCLRTSTFASCKADGDCTFDGVAGHCESGGACSVDDPQCASGRRYHASAGATAGACVESGGSGADARSDTDAAPVAGRECVVGTALPAAQSACAAAVCAHDDACCTTGWDAVCVHRAEQLCHVACSQMAFVGGGPGPVVIDTSTRAIIWQPDDDRADGAAWADFDGDGRADLAVSGYTKLRIYRDEGRGSDGLLRLREVYRLDRILLGYKATWADIDHDGDLDAAFFGVYGVVVVKNHGDGTFGGEQIVAEPPAVVDADLPSLDVLDGAYQDLDGDGFPELVTGSWTNKPARLYRNDHGTFVDTGWTGPPDLTSLVWCNVDDDAPRELIAGSDHGILIFNPNGLDLGHPQTIVSDGTTFEVQCGDLDGDGDLDLLVAGYGGATRAHQNLANGTSWPEAWKYVLEEPNNGEVGIDLGDLDGDGRLDAISSGHGYEGGHPLHLVFYHQPASHTAPIELTAEKFEHATRVQLTRYIELAAAPPIVP